MATHFFIYEEDYKHFKISLISVRLIEVQILYSCSSSIIRTFFKHVLNEANWPFNFTLFSSLLIPDTARICSLSNILLKFHFYFNLTIDSPPPHILLYFMIQTWGVFKLILL